MDTSPDADALARFSSTIVEPDVGVETSAPEIEPENTFQRPATVLGYEDSLGPTEKSESWKDPRPIPRATHMLRGIVAQMAKNLGIESEPKESQEPSRLETLEIDVTILAVWLIVLAFVAFFVALGLSTFPLAGKVAGGGGLLLIAGIAIIVAALRIGHA